jgi:hypothetical protein
MSIIRPTVKLLPGRILIVLLTAITATALIPAGAGAGGPKSHHLVFRLSGPARQDVIANGVIFVNARCRTEACTIVASAISKSPSFRTAKVHAHLPAGTLDTISLPLAPRERGKLKAAFKAGHSPTLTVKAVAHDASGTRVSLSIKVRARKP